MPYIFPSWSKDAAYVKALEFVTKYMDLRTIIEKLQDIDRIKYILFDKKQRKIFDNLPKIELNFPKETKPPGISSSRLTVQDLTKRKKGPSFLMKKIDKYKFLLNGEKANQRLYELLQINVQEKFELIK